jgi:hypothetical protein
VSQVTATDGTTSIGGIQTGTRNVTVMPPAGYTAGPDPLSTIVNVLSGRTVDVTFVLAHSAATLRN